ncbi:MAG: glycosyltransferase [Rhodobacteraceae bacterium]|nr:glycosyltransferase [Paracoccaceae bacterium]
MENRLHIALVSAFPPGLQSLNEYGYHLARGLADRPDVESVTVIADLLDEPAPEFVLDPKIRVRRVWSYNSVTAGPAILKAIRATRPDGVLFNLQTASFGDREIPAALGLLAPALTRAMGYPSGLIAHNILAGIDLEKTILRGQPIRQRIVKAGGEVVTRAMMASSYVTVTLSSYADLLQERFPKADVTLVPHGTFDTDRQDMPALADRLARIVTMGKFGTYKRLETLLEAFDLLREGGDNPDLELVIGGTDHPSTPGYLKEVAEARRDDPGVIFHGYVAEEDIPEFFGNARLCVFDYNSTTGSSGVLHQAASYGTVPVFPRIGDFVDLCQDEGLTGENYAPGDAPGMAAAIARLLRDGELAAEIAEGNRLASLGMPFSQVIEFHVEKFRRLQAGITESPVESGENLPA